MSQLKWYKVYGFSDKSNPPQLAGTVLTHKIQHKNICIAYTGDEWFALDDTCPHAGASFGKGGWCENGALVCPIHRHRFSLKNGRSNMGDYINTYPCEVREDGLYVELEVKPKQWKLWPF